MISAPEFAIGACVLYCSVIANMPKTSSPVITISSTNACIGVIARPGCVKNTPADASPEGMFRSAW